MQNGQVVDQKAKLGGMNLFKAEVQSAESRASFREIGGEKFE